MVDTGCIDEIRDDFLKTQEECSEVTLQTIKEEKLITKLVGAGLKMFAPML